MSATGKISGGIALAGCRAVRVIERPAMAPTCVGEHAHRRRAPPPRGLPRPRASARSSRGRRRRASAPAARRRRRRRPSRVHRADDVRERRRRRAAARRRRASSPSGSPKRASSSVIRGRRSRCTAARGRSGRPISAFSSAGVPSATIRPWSMIPTRSASTSASSRYCVVRNTVTPSSRASRATSSQSAERLCGSSPVVGSSRKRMLGRWTSASARSRRRFMPPE